MQRQNANYKFSVQTGLLPNLRYLHDTGWSDGGCLVQFYCDTRVRCALASKLAFSILHYSGGLFLAKCPGKIWTKKSFSGLLLFRQHRKNTDISEFIWSLWFLFHSGPTSDSLPLLLRFLVSLSLIYKAEALQKNYSGSTSSQNAKSIDNAWKPSLLHRLQKCIGQRKL